MRDAILTKIEDAEGSMTLLQAKDFLLDIRDTVQNLSHSVDDAIASKRADTPCTCSERGKHALHTKACAKTKAVK